MKREMLRPVDNSTKVRIAGPEGVGDLRLWLPEAIHTNTGTSSCYPKVESWRNEGESLIQDVREEELFGPGNCERIDAGTLEVQGIRFPVDCPVVWRAEVMPREDGVFFSIELANRGGTVMRKACAAVCSSFLGARWWKEETAYVISEGKIRSLFELGRDAGRPNDFQAYLVVGESFDHIFYHEYWGINEARLDLPVIVSENPEHRICTCIAGDRAYFLHSNRGNPCTDIMLAFGDIAPGESAVSRGQLWFQEGGVEEAIESSREKFKS
jgi:hypothetical protein